MTWFHQNYVLVKYLCFSCKEIYEAHPAHNAVNPRTGCVDSLCDACRWLEGLSASDQSRIEQALEDL